MADPTFPKWLEALGAKKETLRDRAKTLQLIRDFFSALNFLEVETPIVTLSPGLEPHLKIFRTQFIPENHNVRPSDFTLATSPEYAMKKMVAAGYGDIFQICKCFRNGEYLGRHNPEFTMLEWYRVGKKASDLRNDIENLLTELFDKLKRPLSFKPPFKCISLVEIFKEKTGIDLCDSFSDDEFKIKLQESGMHFTENERVEKFTWTELFTRAFVDKVEPTLPKNSEPFFLVDYPKQAAALATLVTKKGKVLADRFEFYIGAQEIANGWTELRDPHEQRERFVLDLAERRHLYPDEQPLQIDEDYLEALSFLPACAGVALGIDRLVMSLFKKSDIKDVLSFSLNGFRSFRIQET